MKHLEKEVREIFETNKLKALVDKEIDNVGEFLKQAELIYVCNAKIIEHRVDDTFLEDMEKMRYQIWKDSIRDLTIVIVSGNYFVLDGHTILKNGLEHALDIFEDVNSIDEFVSTIVENEYIPEDKRHILAEEVRKGTDDSINEYFFIKELSIGVSL
ncbi:hypothetical protein ACS2B2_25785 [Bacillus cereus group sp. BceL297]|uniref:hypothetical protein n=1 Tax=unclassified Bacillus cereus group TaxID=2750818 RepID=UPI003F28F2F1